MEKLEKKREQSLQALTTLQTAIDTFRKISNKELDPCPQIDYEQLYLMSRDSMVQRFEYCTDLFWKYLKKYIEIVSETTIEYNSPKPVIRQAYSVGILSEKETESSLELIKDRNLTSHIYKEEIAEHLTKTIPEYYKLMHTIIERLQS